MWEYGGINLSLQTQILDKFQLISITQDTFDHDKGQKSASFGESSPVDKFLFLCRT